MKRFIEFVKVFYSLISFHFSLLHRQLESNIDLCGNDSRIQYNPHLHYCFPLILILFAEIYGMIGLELEARHEFQWKSLVNSPFIFTHQTIPPVLWPQFDFSIALNVIASTGVYLALATTRPIGRHFVITKRKDSIFIGERG